MQFRYQGGTREPRDYAALDLEVRVTLIFLVACSTSPDPGATSLALDADLGATTVASATLPDAAREIAVTGSMLQYVDPGAAVIDLTGLDTPSSADDDDDDAGSCRRSWNCQWIPLGARGAWRRCVEVYTPPGCRARREAR